MSESTPQQKQKLRAIFSDIDGTIVHYEAKLKKQGYELVEIQEEENTQTSTSQDVRGDNNEQKQQKQQFDRRIHIWKHTETGKLIPTIVVPSATLGGGFIALSTLELVNKLRLRGVKYCLLTGARTSTFLTRASSGALPRFDFGVCEGGGKIFTHPESSPSGDQQHHGVVLELDEFWINSFWASIGDWKENRKNFPQNPENRQGPLWNLYKRLKTESGLLLRGEKQEASGFPKLDATDFDSAFMVDLRQLHQPPSDEGNNNQNNNNNNNAEKPKLLVCGVDEVNELEQGLKNIVNNSPEYKDSLTVCVNLGKGHISAKGCTKADVVKYLSSKKIQPTIKLFSSDDDEDNNQQNNKNDEEDSSNNKEIVAGMFDDENDLGFVELCHVGFAPSIAHPSVDVFLKKHQEELKEKARYRKCKIEGFLGTEEALTFLLENYC